MLQKCLFITVVTCLILAGCSIGLNNSVAVIKIVQIGGENGVVYVDNTIQLEITPDDTADAASWSLLDADHPDNACADINQNGQVSGQEQCVSITVVAESSNGATDDFPLEVQLESQDDNMKVKKPISK